jgi:glycosyltransferase involved in cell wall biosynthesis
VTYPLAIFTKEFGMATQTFVRRHIVGLLPGRTVVICETVHWTYDGTMDGKVPVLVLNRLPRGLFGRGVKFVSRVSGWSHIDPRVDAVRRFFRKHGVEVVMGEHLDHSLPWLDVAKALGLRFFPHGHGYDVSGRLRDASLRSDYLKYNGTEGVITVSHASKERLVGIGLHRDKVHVIPCSVEVPPLAQKRPTRREVRVLAVGRMVDKKAPITALDAFRRAVAVYPHLHLDFVGDGPLLSAAQEFVHCFNLASCVTLHGAKPNEEVKRMMNETDIFIQHSIVAANGDEEGMPVAILEAMAAALPVVSTRHAGIPEVVEDGVTGFLVEERDSGMMAARLVDLARDEHRRVSMGHVGWARVGEAFSWEEEQRRLRELLGLQAYA